MSRLGCECPEPGYCYTIEHGDKVKAYNELDSHEHLLFCSKTDDGENLSPDFLKKLFEANAINESTWSGDNVEEQLTESYEQQLYDLKHDVYSKSEEYVSFEIISDALTSHQSCLSC